jgi:hypothetical protein
VVVDGTFSLGELHGTFFSSEEILAVVIICFDLVLERVEQRFGTDWRVMP